MNDELYVVELLRQLREKDVLSKELNDKLKDILDRPTKRTPKSKKNIYGEVYIPEEELIGSLKAKPDISGYKAYSYYANKYKIPLVKEGKKRTLKELTEAIHKYEMKNKSKLMKKGVDQNTGAIGLYLI